MAAAQEVFSKAGYSQAGIRDIAAIAETSTTLLLRYFDSKAGLFEAALIAAMRMDELLAVERSGFGSRFASLLARRDLDMLAPSMIALATGDANAREIAARATTSHTIEPLAVWLGPPDARTRAMEIVMIATGFVTYARQLPILPADQPIDGRLVEWLGRSIQAVVDRSR